MSTNTCTETPVTVSQQGALASSKQTRTEACERLTAGSLYYATVISTDPALRKLSVKTNTGDIINNCALMTDSLASMLGFAQIGMPPTNSKVLVAYTTNGSYVCGNVADMSAPPTIFTLPVAGEYDQDHSSDPAIGVRRKKEDKSPGLGYQGCQDMMPGEYDLSNNMGIFFRMLHNFTQLGAGDLAKIECHLVNDMVRIIDNYFVHHNAGGDTMIWSNGRCNYESHFTGYPGEAEGGNTDSSTPAEAKGENVYKCDDDHNLSGKWRRSKFIGFLADMVHEWITEPPEYDTVYNKEAMRKGKLRIWHGSDGTYMVQSNAGIHLSVSPRIVIPIMNYKWDDPEHDALDLVKNLNRSYTKVWKGDKANARAMVWQMRSYAKYITLFHSLERWLQMRDKEWITILTEDDSICGSSDNREPDKDSTEFKGQASITITPGGDISLEANGVNNDGTSSIVLSNGNIQIAAANNIELLAGGYISMSCRNLVGKATNNVELVSLCGNMFLKARTALKALCEKGVVWIRSNKHQGAGATAEPWCGGDAGQPSSHDSSKFGIRLEATDTPVLVTGWRGIVNRTKEDNAHIWLYTEKNSDVRIASNKSGKVKIRGENEVIVEAGNKFKVRTEKALITGPTYIQNSTSIADGTINTKHDVNAGGSMNCNGTVSNRSGGQLSKRREELKPKTKGDNSTEEEELKDLKKDPEERSEEEAWLLYEWTTPTPGYTEFRGLKQAPHHAAYEEGGRQDGAMAQLIGLIDWSVTAVLDKDWEPTTSFPWPGKNAKYSESVKFGKALGDNWTRDYTESDIGGKSKEQIKPYSFRIQASD